MSSYQCVVCGTHEGAKATTTCPVCLSQRPSVEGVEIGVVQPAPKLRATAASCRRQMQSLRYVRGLWESLRASTTNSARRRHAERAILAHEALLALSDDIGGTIERSFVKLPAPHWLDDILSLDGSNAWDVDHMLPYFYQDWHSTGDYPEMRDRISSAIAEHASATKRLLVMGAGACGLVRDLAGSGLEVHATDLSLPCLLLASRLLRGVTLDVTVPHKFERDWRHAVLPGAAPFVIPPRTCVANAARLPLQNKTFTVVVTQNLIDIATNPTQIIVEIARVLEAGGLWVNVGLPFALSNEPVELGPICDDALGSVLHDLGFELLSLERHAYRLSDTGALFDWPEVTTHWPQISVARRASANLSETPDVFQGFRAGISDAVWECRPRRLPGRLLRGGPGSTAVSDASAAVVRWLGTRSDGQTPLGTLRREAGSVDARITDLDILEVVRHLCDEGMMTLA